MPRASKAKTKVPGGFEDSVVVEPSTSVVITSESTSTNPFDSSAVEARMPEEYKGDNPVAFSTPIRPSTNVTFGEIPRVNVSAEEKEALDDKGITHWESSLLTTIHGPLQNLKDGSAYYSDAEIDFIACRPLANLTRLGNNAGKLIGRVMRAIELGSKYLERDVRGNHGQRYQLTRREERTIFKSVLDPLEELLCQVVRYDDEKRTGYGLEQETWDRVQEKLRELRREAASDILDEDVEVPRLPIWEKGGDVTTFWKANDFEIIGACYRTEVEKFLAFLSDHHQFKGADSPRGLSKEEKVKGSIKDIEKERREFERERGYSADTNSDNNASSISRALVKGRAWKGLPTDTLSHPVENNSSKRMKEIFTTNLDSTRASRPSDNLSEVRRNETSDKPTDAKKDHQYSRNPDSGPPDGDDDDDPSNRGKAGPNMPRKNPGKSKEENKDEITIPEPQFDNKLKIDTIPTWDGNPDTLGRWALKINRLADRSETIHRQLGYLVPARLTGSAEVWYYSQSLETCMKIETNWTELRNAIGTFYMNRAYMNRQKNRANKASYRDLDNSKESPSEYFIRKVELLNLVYEYNDAEMINEVMSGAPSYWSSIITPHLYKKLEEFQLAIKFHEDNLLNFETPRNRTYGYNREGSSVSRNPFNQYRNAKTNLVGWSKETLNPPFPKDDSVVSPKLTPEDKGARPCRHCGSGKHWDPECKYARKGEKRVRVNKVEVSEESRDAQDQYDALYFEEISDEEDDKDF